MADYEFDKVSINGDVIRMHWRYWDGVDRPDYTIFVVSSQEARGIIEELKVAIPLSEENARNQRQKAIQELIDKRDELTKRIENLQADV